MLLEAGGKFLKSGFPGHDKLEDLAGDARSINLKYWFRHKCWNLREAIFLSLNHLANMQKGDAFASPFFRPNILRSLTQPKLSQKMSQKTI